MEHMLDQPMEQADFDYEKALLKAVYRELLIESARAIDENYPDNSHSTENKKPFFTTNWIDDRGYNCHLRAVHSITQDTALADDEKKKLKVNFYFTYSTVDYEPRQLFYSSSISNRITPIDDVADGIGDVQGEKLRNSDYVFGSEVLESLKQRPGRLVYREEDAYQLQLYALDLAVGSKPIQKAIANIDVYGRHASKQAVDAVIDMVLRREPMIDAALVRKRVEDEYCLREAA